MDLQQVVCLNQQLGFCLPSHLDGILCKVWSRSQVVCSNQHKWGTAFQITYMVYFARHGAEVEEFGGEIGDEEVPCDHLIKVMWLCTKLRAVLLYLK